MKRCFKNYWLATLLVFCCGLVNQVSAQSFRTLHVFGGDGATPGAGMILVNNKFYGATASSVFAINTDGTGFSTIYYGDVWERGKLAASGGALYGTSYYGPGPGVMGGDVFRVNTDGTGFMTLHVFDGSPGSGPWAGVVVSNGVVYGTTVFWPSNLGSIFRVNSDGTGFTNLHNFTGGTDGGNPYSQLVLSGNNLFGTTSDLECAGNGKLFAIGTDGSGFETLHSFDDPESIDAYTGLFLSGKYLYGRASTGTGDTIFSLNTDRTGYKVIYDSSLSIGSPVPQEFILSGNTFYGINPGLSGGIGTVSALNMDGTGFTLLHEFSPAVYQGLSLSGTNSDGAWPHGLAMFGKTFFGVTQTGGITGAGTLFSIDCSPQLQILPSDSGIVLSWPTNYAGFDYTGYILQTTTNLWTPVWTTNLPAPAVVNGQYTVTNSISGTQQFFRLSQ